MFHCLTPSQTNLTAFLLDDFFDKSLGFMLAVWPCRLFLCLGPRCRPVLGRHCSEQNVPPGTDDRARRALGFLQPLNGLYTHASWQLPEPLKLTNLFEDRQSTPERTLRWLPLCTVAFSNLVAAFHSCLAFHPLIIWFIDCQFVLYIFRRHGGLIPIVSEAIPMIWCGFFFGVAPAPFCVGSLFSLLAKRKSGREICVSSLLPCLFLSFWFFHGFAS